MPNGSTIQIREDDEDFARIMSQGAADQGSTQASGYSAASWYAPGGQGYLDAMRGGFNDPTSDPSNPQPFSAAAIMNQNNNGLLTQPRPGGGGLLGGGGSGSGYGGGGGSYGSGGLTYGGFTPANPTIGGACIITVNDGSEIVRGHPEQVQPIQHL